MKLQHWRTIRRVLAEVIPGMAAMLFSAAGSLWSQEASTVSEERIGEVRSRVLPKLDKELRTRGFKPGDPAFIRVFKETRELELWLKPASSNRYQLCKKWPIAAMSGSLGPKLKMGDKQAPEGFYSVNQKSLNPLSRFHLSFNIGYPNAYDQAQGCTGNLIMVHGNQVSIGCFAMTDPVIEEIYLLVETALAAGQQEIPIHAFPFRMTPERLAEASASPWFGFWKHLQVAYDAFERNNLPPVVNIRDGAYVFP